MRKRDGINAPDTQKQRFVLFIDSLGGGGAERVASILCNKLVASEHYYVDIVMLREAKIQYALDSRIKLYYADNMPVTYFYGKMTRKVFSFYKMVRQRMFKPVMKFLGMYDAFPKIDETEFYFYSKYAIPYHEFLNKSGDCIACGFLIRSNIAMLMAAKGTKAKTIFCERNNPVRQDIASSLIRMRDRLSHCCDKSVFQTEEQRKHYSWIQQNIAVIPNPIKDDLPKWSGGTRRHEIINFCRLNKQKNLPLLIDAYEILHKVYPDYSLKIYGNGDEKEKLQQYIEEKHLQHMVTIEDFQPNIHEVVKSASMFVSTSDYEGISNSMIEAMAIGLPVICTDCDGGGARMMIQDHENGLIVPKGDLDAVYRAMKEIIENPELAKKLSEEAYKIRDKLSTDKIVQKWMEVIE